MSDSIAVHLNTSLNDKPAELSTRAMFSIICRVSGPRPPGTSSRRPGRLPIWPERWSTFPARTASEKGRPTLLVPCEEMKSMLPPPWMPAVYRRFASAYNLLSQCRWRGKGPRVPENPDCQSRRNRLPHRQDGSAHGDCDGRGLFRGG